MKPATQQDIDRLKYWLDTEITFIHIQWAILLGVVVGGKIWFVVGAYTLLSLIYAIKRMRKLPSNYLSTKEAK